MLSRPPSMRFLASISLLLLPSTTLAQFVVESLSFGHLQDISPNGRNVPGWAITGEGHDPQVLSDRIVLTPPAPGNRRGALWTDHQVNYQEWNVDVEFRASGPERGSGNLQLWLTKEKTEGAGLASVYTVDRFDGLALQLDQYGGMGGGVRGFLSDGSVSYKTHHSVDSLAFGHCDYAYRNLGRPSKLRVKQDQSGLEVSVDDRPCFKSNQIQIPGGYFFGVSAASAENPDSFEIYKFVVSTTTSTTREEIRPNPPPQEQAPPPPPAANEPPTVQPAAPEPPPHPFTNADNNNNNNAAARSTVQIDAAQLHDLLTRLDAATSNIATLHQELRSLDERHQQRHAELRDSIAKLPTSPPPAFPQDLLNAVSRRVENIDGVVARIQRDVEGRDYKEHLTGLQETLREGQERLLDSLPVWGSHLVSTTAPKMGLFIGVVFAFQIMLAAAYIFYKRRRANSPKKLL